MHNVFRKRLLFLSAHMDDFEFGGGGIISSLGAAQSHEMYFCALSDYRKAYDGQIQEKRAVNEQIESLAALGIISPHLKICSEIPSQLYPEHRQLVLETLYQLKSEIRPEVIFTPSLHDVHQDHRVVAECALKAFKQDTLIGYEVVNSTYGFNPNFYMPLTGEDVKRKIAAIQCYKTQYMTENTTGDYFNPEVIKSLAISRGARIGVPFAEAFEIYQLIGKF